MQPDATASINKSLTHLNDKTFSMVSTTEEGKGPGPFSISPAMLLG